MNTLTATFVKALPEVTGQGKNGEWRKTDFIVKTNDSYPKQVCFTVWGDTTKLVKELKEGEVVSVSFDIESREYNSRWYTEAKALKIEKQATPKTTPPAEPAQPAKEFDGDLPF